MDRRSLLTAAAALAAVLAFGELSRFAASFARPAMDFDLGPSTGEYLQGFTESEERLPVTFRWTGERASLRLPLETSEGEATLLIRYARFLEGSATVRLFADGVPAGSFSARSGRFRTQEMPITLGPGPFELELLVDDPDPSRLGIAVDWVRIEHAQFRLRESSLAPRLVLLGLFVLSTLLGLSLRTSVLVTGATAGAQALWFASSPFAMAHVHRQMAYAGLIATALVAFAFIRHRGSAARFVPLLFFAAYALKGAALFHPSYFYPDVRLHRRHLETFATAEGSIVERGIAAQKVAQTAYPRRVAGKDYAFPYSPVFYVPFTWFDSLRGNPRGIEAAMKHVGLLFAALELPLVFLLARALIGAQAALWASALAIVLPPMVSRLLYAQWPTMAGHCFDLVALVFATQIASAPRQRKPFVLYAASGFVSCLVYVSSLINLSLFTGFLSLILERKRRWGLLLLWAGVGLATVLLLYRPFLVAVFTEIVPALARGEGGGDGNPAAGVTTTLLRIYYFYGIGFPALALAGLLLALRNEARWVGRFLVVYLASFAALLALRAGSGMFKDLKELVFAGPFVAVTVGLSLESLRRRGRAEWWAAIFIALGLVAFGAEKYLEYFHQHTTLAGLP